MPLYYFVLKTRRKVVPDRDGVELSDEAAAREHAIGIAREIMRNRELNTRSWRIEVRDEDLQLLSGVLFAEIDETIQYWPSEFRDSYVAGSRNMASRRVSFSDVRNTLEQERATLTHASQVMTTVVGYRRQL